ncbi:uncharacterized protein ACRADG_010953 [Cochliomyia hominivorax]
MSRLSNCILRLALYYGLFFGYTYIYVNDKERYIKIFASVKIYVYIINLVTLALIILFTVDNYETSIFYSEDPATAFAIIVSYFARFVIYAGITLLRIREEKALEKWLKIFLPLELTYFPKLYFITCNENIKNILVFNIIIIMFYNFCIFLTLLPLIAYGDWWTVMDIFLESYIVGMQHYVLLHHAFMLCYINYCFAKLNKLLEHQQMQEGLARIHLKYSLLLQQVNSINGPVIFLILVSLLVTNSLYICGTLMSIYENRDIITSLISEYLKEICILLSLFIDMFLYFLICERICGTTKETGRILMEYNARTQNHDVFSN